MTFRLGLLAASLLATSATSFAQDLQVTGVVTATIDGEHFSFEGEDWFWWRGDGLFARADISGKAGIVISPDVSVQLDAWAGRGAGRYDAQQGDGISTYDYYGNEAWTYLAGAAHLTYRTGDFLIGAVGGLGHAWYSESGEWWSDEGQNTYLTVGVEGGIDRDDFRLIGQLGVSKAIAGDEAEEGDITPFAAISGTYYFDPNFALTASAMIANEYEDDTEAGELDLLATVGAELRYKVAETPLILSAGYKGNFWHSTNGGDYNFHAVAHRATVGVSIPFGAGADTLRDLDRATGLTLNDPTYGLN